MKFSRFLITGGLLISALFLLSIPLSGQEENTTDNNSRQQEEELRKRSLSLEIQTANFYQLLSLCREEDLATTGTKEELQQRLYSHFGIAAADTDAELSRKKQIVNIETAIQTEYFSLEKVDEQNMILRGRVRLKMTDTEEGNRHSIEADEVLFNQSKNSFTARGNVSYRLDRGDSSELFTGSSLSFQLDTWEGFFIEGTSTETRTVEGEKIDFRYSGDVISRNPDDVIVLEDGNISSSRASPPNYYISARKIWVLSPGEWGIQDAVLHVGRVPVLYFPLFFRPADALIFHPVIGDRPREGNFIQTTTYILGEKAGETNPFSFLQLSDEEEGVRETEAEGLFLRKTGRRKKETENPWLLKAMLDMYTKLGAYAAIEGSYSGGDVLQSLNFSAGFGMSRNIYPENGPPFRPYYIDADGRIRTFWNKSNFSGLAIPFRYMLTYYMKLSDPVFNILFDIDLYSDPYFSRDFQSRSEDIDWNKLLGFEAAADPLSPAINSLDWNITTSITMPSGTAAPLIRKLALQNLSFSLSWGTRFIPDSLLPHYLQNAHLSPESIFFYPDLLTHPDVSASLTGNLLSISDSKRSKADAVREPSVRDSDALPLLKTPWDTDASVEESETQEGRLFRLPPMRPDISLPPEPDSYRFHLNYAVNPKFTWETKMDSGAWQQPSDINLNVEYSSINLRNTADLSYSLSLYQKLFTLNGSIRFTSQFRDVYNKSDSLTEIKWDDLKLQAYQYSLFGIRNSITLATYPFSDDTVFGASNIHYSLHTLLFDRRFDSLDSYDNPIYVDSFVQWNTDYIDEHSVGLSLNAQFLSFTQQLSLEADLPPHDGRFSAELKLGAGPFSSRLTSSLTKSAAAWELQPLQSTSSLKVDEWLLLEERFVYTPSLDTISSSSSSLKLDFFNVKFDALLSRAYEFQGAGIGWSAFGDTVLRPARLSIGLDIEPETEAVWKNRIRWGMHSNTSLNVNLLRFTESSLVFTLGVDLYIHEFLTLSFSSQSSNDFIYQYIPGLPEKIGRPWRDPFTDLLKSFNFFNIQDRYDSFFNLDSLSVSAVHHLEDWDLTIEYSGRPNLKTDNGGTPRYVWDSIISISLVWIPIPEIERSIRITDDVIQY
jgi:lipopolysaccharide assembly outer membrane protein LptD (OstA)